MRPSDALVVLTTGARQAPGANGRQIDLANTVLARVLRAAMAVQMTAVHDGQCPLNTGEPCDCGFGEDLEALFDSLI